VILRGYDTRNEIIIKDGFDGFAHIWRTGLLFHHLFGPNKRAKL
jgi:hypothetical protein